MVTQKQKRGALGMSMVAVLAMTSAVAAQFQGSAAPSDVSGPPASSAGVVAGSVAFQDANGEVIGAAWVDLGYAFAGVAGDPKLSGSGLIAPGKDAQILLEDAAPLAMAVLFVGVDTQPIRVPFKGGTIVIPAPTLQVVVATDRDGRYDIAIPASVGLPAGLDIVMQYAIVDAAAPQGVSLSNALQTATH